MERESSEGFAKDVLGRHRAGHGYRRIGRELRRTGVSASGKRVPRIVRRLGSAAKGATGEHGKPKAVEPGGPRPNVVERAFSAGGKGRLRMGGVARIPAKEGRPCPACVVDAFPRKAVGRPMPDRIAEKIAIGAIGQAIGRENPQAAKAHLP